MSDPVEQLLRETFQAEADATTPHPDLAGAARGYVADRRGPGRWQVLGAAAAAVLVVVGAGVVLSRPGDGGRPLTPAANDPAKLRGSEWRLVEYTVDGRRTVVSGLHASLGFGDDDRYSGRVCNQFGGNARVTDTHVEFSDTITTDMFCAGAPGDAERAVHTVATGRVAWSVDDDTLRLTKDDRNTLVLRKHDGVPDDGASVLESGSRGDVEYRLLLRGTGDARMLRAEKRTGPGAAWEYGAVGAPDSKEPTTLEPLTTLSVGAETYVAGWAPRSATRVTHQTAAGAEERELTLYRPDGLAWNVFGGFVAEHSRSSVLTAYDADGKVVGRWERR